ncbi:hypothetical protein [Massilia sp. CF038]|uniref:hypothetical protein n=1 Tax=Massilia sp. CF038 TaxID=1881045 RepID=UPI0009326E4F|nr:hypothetical protein [Massilia sp. CF038]
MMKLNIEILKNLATDQLLEQENIPCFCRVAQEFEIIFQDPFPEVVGVVSDWDRRELEKRAPAGGGGKYTHYTNGMVTLKEIGINQYEIKNLSLFNRISGWSSIIENGIYAAPKDFWDEE